MDAFDFLAPWINRLAPALMANRDTIRGDAFFLHHCDAISTLTPCAHGLVLMPFYDIPGKAWNGQDTSYIVNGFPAVRYAMEIVALALRLEPRVWTLLRSGRGAKLVPNGDDLCGRGADIEIAFLQNDFLSASVIPKFFTMRASPALTLEFEAAKEKLHALDHTGRLIDYQIPLTITARLVRNWASESYAKAISELYELVYGLSLDGDDRVIVQKTPFRPARVAVPLQTVDFDWIERLTIQGIPVDRLVAEDSRDFVDAFTLLQDTGRPLAIEATVSGDPTMNGLFGVLQCGEHIDALGIRVTDKCDGALFGRVLAASIPTCPSLRRLEIDCPKKIMPKHVKALEATQAMAVRGRQLQATVLKPVGVVESGAVLDVFPCNETYLSFVVLPGNTLKQVNTSSVQIRECDGPSRRADSALEVVRLRLASYDACARRLVALVVGCLPRQIKALTLQIDEYPLPSDYYWTHDESDAEGGPPLDGDAVASIFAAAPELEKLELRLPPLMPLDDVLAAYEDGRCHARALSFVGSSTVAVALLKALANPVTRAYQTIEELSLACPKELGAELDAFMDAVKAVLRVNDRLAYLKLSGNRLSAQARLDKADRVRLASRVRVAFASVMRHYESAALGRVDAALLSRVVAFAEAPRRCSVELAQ